MSTTDDLPLTSSELSAGARRAIEAIERTAREQLAGLSRKDALDALDTARERLIRIASEDYGGVSIGETRSE